MAVLNPDHLLDQADRLTDSTAAGAPRHADLRRAISSAYYGVFHAIATKAADDLIGSTMRHTSRYAMAYRSIDHKSLRTICADIMKPTLPNKYRKYKLEGGFGDDIEAVATAVSELQEMRHEADYDPLYRTNMSDAVLAIKTGRSALYRFRNSNAVRRKTFLSLIVFNLQ